MQRVTYGKHSIPVGRRSIAISLAEIAERPALRSPQTMAELRDVAMDLEQSDLIVLWTDLTAPELFPHGQVVKVVIPQMVPLPQLHRVRWLGTRDCVGPAMMPNRLRRRSIRIHTRLPEGFWI